MKNFIVLLSFLVFFSNTSAQTQQGDLLLESTITGSWTSIALSDKSTFGYYLNENLAITLGFNIGLIDSDINDISIGSRYHLNEHVLTFLDIDLVSENFNLDLGLGYRFYANDWMALEPRIGLEYTESLLLKSSINLSLYFNKP